MFRALAQSRHYNLRALPFSDTVTALCDSVTALCDWLCSRLRPSGSAREQQVARGGRHEAQSALPARNVTGLV